MMPRRRHHDLRYGVLKRRHDPGGTAQDDRDPGRGPSLSAGRNSGARDGSRRSARSHLCPDMPRRTLRQMNR
jgi:hypothetical protein